MNAKFVFKVLLVGLVAVVGMAGGIYIGYAVIGIRSAGPSLPPFSNEVRVDPADALTFAEGDLFPLETYGEPSGDSGNFETLLQDKKSAIIFASIGCGPCDRFFEQWETTVKPAMLSNVQVVVCVVEKDPGLQDIPEDYSLGKKMVIVNAHRFFEYYNVKIYPTIVGVDEFGLVTCIQYGYKPNISRDILEQFTNYEF